MTVFTFALVHSPLVGPVTWGGVAQTLSAEGFAVRVATLGERPEPGEPWWRHHVMNAARTLSGIEAPYALAGHSGAGPLLPLIAQRLSVAPAACLFVDAGILWKRASRLEMIYGEDKAWGQDFEAHLRAGGCFPDWTEEQLAEFIPGTHERKALLQSVRPMPLSYFTEAIPCPSGWYSSGFRCAYLLMSDSYWSYAGQAEANGWRVERLEGHHFTTMTEPERVAASMIRLAASQPG